MPPDQYDAGPCEVAPKDVATTVNDRLTSKKLRLESELKDVNAALDALNANPEIARVLSLVGKAVGRL